jgi:hypothetical protein
MSIDNDIRCKLERAIVRALIQECARAGWSPVAVDDGGDKDVKVSNEDEAIDAVFAVDESRLYFRVTGSKGGKRNGVFLVGGNGEDIISDWHCGNASFDAAVNRVAMNVGDLTTVSLKAFEPCPVKSPEGDEQCTRPAGHKHDPKGYYAEHHQSGSPSYKRW